MAKRSDVATRKASPPKRLDRLTRHLILTGVHDAGTYDPDLALMSVEESMTLEDFQAAEPFLSWCHNGGRKFGHGNIDRVYAEFFAATVRDAR